MGENRADRTAPSKDEAHVLITGFGPWAANAINPAFLVAKGIHERLDIIGGPAIHTHALTEPVRVSYKTVLEQIPPLLFPPVTHDPPPIFDLVVFIGMAAGRSYYTLETRAARDGYKSPDCDGEVLQGADKDMWKQLYNAPEVLTTGFDTDDVWRRWKSQVMDMDVRPSTDAGRYLCEFIYYTGLVEYWRRRRGESTPVVFLHVPGDHDNPAVDCGVRVAEALIRALVQSGRANCILK